MLINIAGHIVNGEPTDGYFWLIFPDGSGFGQNTSSVRQSKDGNNYGLNQLTELGGDALAALSADLFEVWTDNAEKRIRCQVKQAWHIVKIGELVSAIEAAKASLQKAFGASAQLVYGEADPIS